MKWWFLLCNKSSIKTTKILPAAYTNLNSTIICPEEYGLLAQ